MAKQLYDYWFVQFDFPNEEGKPYKSSGGKMVWNEKLKREIPEGWNISLIKDIATTYSGGTPKSTNIEYYDNGEIAWMIKEKRMRLRELAGTGRLLPRPL